MEPNCKVTRPTQSKCHNRMYMFLSILYSLLCNNAHTTTTNEHFATFGVSSTGISPSPLPAPSCFRCRTIVTPSSTASPIATWADSRVSRIRWRARGLSLCASPHMTPTTSVRHSLHWLPIREMIRYKIALMTLNIKLQHQPVYLYEYLITYEPFRNLRSSGTNLLSISATKKKAAARTVRAATPHIRETTIHLLQKSFFWGDQF